MASVAADPGAVASALSSLLNSLSHLDPHHQGPDDTLLSAVDQLCGANLASRVAGELQHRAQQDLKDSHLPRLWSQLQGCVQAGELDAGLPRALEDLRAVVASQRELLVQLSTHMLRNFPQLPPPERIVLLGAESQHRHRVGAMLLTTPPVNLSDLLRAFYAGRLSQFSAALEDGGEVEEGSSGEDAVMGECSPSKAVAGTLGQGWGAAVEGVAAAMRTFGLEAVSEDAYAAVVCEHLRAHLSEQSQAAFDTRTLEAALDYSRTAPLHFLRLVLPLGDKGTAALRLWQARLGYYVYETVGTLRIRSFFDIVVDYPDSLAAIEDLKECLANTSLHRRVVTVFGAAIQDRLLHPGAATTDIIQQYVSTIRALQHVDPSGVILDAVGAPIREYLRGRKDTIRCIVTMLTDDGEDAAAQSLFAELAAVGDRGGAGGDDSDSDFDGPDADEAALREAERWEPDPAEADPGRLTRSQGGGDVISMLVGIYGSKELFINEYRMMLADRLLSKSDYDCDRELRTLELLKVRFGEANLHNAEVMLKDLSDSRRINSNVQSVPNNATPLKRRTRLVDTSALSATIVSQLFWPTLPTEDFTPVPVVAAMLETYGHKYHSLKAPRKLQWKHSLGTVALELTIGSQTLQFNVPPLLASILLQFQDRGSWPAAELAASLGTTPDALRRKTIFWINQGVLSESKAPDGALTYARNESLQSSGAMAGDADMMADMDEVAGQDTGLQDMAKYEPFIMGMLTNFDSLPLDRIHNMLKMFVTDPPYDKSTDQLATYLGAMVVEEKLNFEGGAYRKR